MQEKGGTEGEYHKRYFVYLPELAITTTGGTTENSSKEHSLPNEQWSRYKGPKPQAKLWWGRTAHSRQQWPFFCSLKHGLRLSSQVLGLVQRISPWGRWEHFTCNRMLKTEGLNSPVGKKPEADRWGNFPTPLILAESSKDLILQW